MAESTKVQLKDVAGTPVYPVTTADQVKTADGGNVEAEIKALKALLLPASGRAAPWGGGDVGDPARQRLQAGRHVHRQDRRHLCRSGLRAGRPDPVHQILEEEAADTDWTVVQNNVVRAVKGPESAADGNLMAFDGTSGTVAKDSGIKLDDVSTAVAQNIATTMPCCWRPSPPTARRPPSTARPSTPAFRWPSSRRAARSPPA